MKREKRKEKREKGEKKLRVLPSVITLGMRSIPVLCCFLLFSLLTSHFSLLFANEASQLATIKFGTDSEIAALIQTLRNENADHLDDELIAVAQTTRNTNILGSVFAFFGQREQSGLEERAIRAIEERESEANATVLAAIDYLGHIRASAAVPVLIELLDSEERRFMNNAFRALGRAASADEEAAEIAAEFLIDFYENRNPGAENARVAIIAIGATRSPLGIPLLAEIAANNYERMPLRIAALEGLSAAGSAAETDPAALEAILDSVGANDPHVRSAAVAALGPFSGEEVDRAILDAFRDSFYRTRIAAARASRERRLEAAVPFLQFRAERDEVPAVRDEAIRALGAIGNDEALAVLDTLFLQRRGSDRIRILAAEMVMQIDGERYLSKLIIELDEARARNQTALSNGLLRVVGEAVINGDTSEMERLTRRFMNGGLMEKLYSLDMVVNNNLTSLTAEVISMTRDRNQSVAGKARRTAARLGIEIPEDEE